MLNKDNHYIRCIKDAAPYKSILIRISKIRTHINITVIYMSKKFFKYEIIGFIFVSIIGTINHFLFELLGNSVIIGLFCPVNESVWEHQKLLFFPFLIWSIAEYFLLERQNNFFPAKTVGITCGIIFTIAFYYSYKGISGGESMFFDILSFYVGVGISFLISYMIVKNYNKSNNHLSNISVLILILISAVFIIFTFAPPLIPLFKDPLTSTYGI